MTDEKRKILEMVGEGKISQEDALRLLEALGDEPEAPAPEPPVEPEVLPRQEDIWGEVEEAAREVGQVLSQTAAVAVDAVTEGLKGAVQKIPGVGPWWDDEGSAAYTCSEGSVSVEKIEIQWITGPVEIVPWEGNYVNVTEYCQRPLDEGQQLEMTVTSGGTMRIRWTRDKSFWSGLRLSKHLQVQVPVGLMLEKVRVSNVSGAVTAQGLCAGKWDLNTTSGRIEAAGVQAEKLKLTSVSGGVHVENVQADELRLGTTSGRIEAHGFGAKHAKINSVSGAVEAYGNGESFEVKTVSGAILLQTEQPPESVRLESMSGRVTLVLPQSCGFTAQYESMSGTFTTGFPVASGLGGKSGVAICGDGGINVNMHTMSGKMEICPAEG